METLDSWRAIPLLEAIPDEQVRSYLPRVRATELSKGASTHRCRTTAHDFCFVARGRVKLVKSDPRATIVGLVHAGQLVCSSVPYVCGEFCCTAITDAEPTVVLSIPRNVLLEIMSRYPLVARGFMHAQAVRAQLLCSRVHELASGRVEQRIARLLVRLGQHFGRSDGGSVRVDLPLSRRDLAELSGTSTETAIRIMSRLERQRVVTSDESGFVVLDGVRLDAIVEGTALRVAPDEARVRKPG